ncbi:AcrR family transcriptional regulator [Salirhabdus euzebyi]|uniref:AcrR family transcriptional regulator n=1 Tax=Salirhabdus euzebyi TaxID=394506 RepID=A0A841Q8M1_9BACI|nr:TetR/AcrR family transcriptional regulator [Salirhabdus euzebyi]MBB6454735.1 AcrR family transcriptional regulator [Salirhabdus euzebyi]
MKGSNTKDQIIAEASKLFLDEGYEMISMRKIATKVGCSPTNLYRHFQNKEDILLVLLERGYSVFLSYIQQAIDQNKELEFRIKLKQALKSYVNFGLENKEYYQLMFIRNFEHFDRVVIGESDRMKGFNLLANLIQEGMEKGLVKGDIEVISQSLWGLIHGITSLLITFKNSFHWTNEQSLIDFHVDTYLKGLLK